jgi:hypothetical protein
VKEWEEEEGKQGKRRRGEGGGEKEERRREIMGRGGGIRWRRGRGGREKVERGKKIKISDFDFLAKSKTSKNYVFLFDFWESKKSINAWRQMKLDVKFCEDTFSYKKIFIGGHMQPEKSFYRKIAPFLEEKKSKFMFVNFS